MVFCAARADLFASSRTSSATTAKPLPATPARAASTAAFKARILVWKAISSMVLMIFPISLEDWLILYISSIICSIRALLSSSFWDTSCVTRPVLTVLAVVSSTAFLMRLISLEIFSTCSAWFIELSDKLWALSAVCAAPEATWLLVSSICMITSFI